MCDGNENSMAKWVVHSANIKETKFLNVVIIQDIGIVSVFRLYIRKNLDATLAIHVCVYIFHV